MGQGYQRRRKPGKQKSNPHEGGMLLKPVVTTSPLAGRGFHWRRLLFQQISGGHLPAL